MENNIENFKCLILDEEKIKDVRNIANGAYFPLRGFLRENDFKDVVGNMCLAGGEIWSIPIVLDINEEDYERITNEENILLKDELGNSVALLKNIEIYSYDKEFFAKNVFGTLDREHPGVKEVYEMDKYLVGGDIEIIDDSRWPFPKHNFNPQETKNIFKDRGWKTVVAFQTRNIPHRPHEFLQKMGLQNTDGLFIQPVIGRKKPGDFKDDVILGAYRILIDKYHQKDKVHFGILPLKMRYAGPREAVFHALLRRNYGCTHFIVGRDHAGIGNYYGPYDAQNIFDEFDKDKLGIEILKYDNVAYCNKCGDLVPIKDCPHEKETKIFISGSKLREMIKNKEDLPEEFIRKEVADFLMNHPDPFVE